MNQMTERRIQFYFVVTWALMFILLLIDMGVLRLR